MSDSAAAELIGLVLAGGQSRRMQRDKGALEYHGMPQAKYCHRLLAAFCERVFVSVSARQGAIEPYRGLPLIEDSGEVGGPAAGLLAAWALFPDAALLTLAVDLPLVDAALLETLVARRRHDRDATAFVHPDGVPEPLCAIWEPSLRAALLEAAAGRSLEAAAGRSLEAAPGRSPSLSRLLEAADVERLAPPEPERLASVNTDEAFRRTLARTKLG